MHEPILVPQSADARDRPHDARVRPFMSEIRVFRQSWRVDGADWLASRAACKAAGFGRGDTHRGLPRTDGAEHNRDVEHLIKRYPLELGALEIQYIEEYFGEFPRKKTAAEIVARLRDRESLILMAEAALPDDPSSLVPVSFKVVHELKARESDQKLADLVARLKDAIVFDGRKVLYSWVGGTRRDWRGQGHFRALTEESEAWAAGQQYHEVVVKTKNRFYDMRSTLDHLQFDVVKFEVDAADQRNSKVYLSKQITADVVRAHTSARTVTHV
jgi:hypothetical protein